MAMPTSLRWTSADLEVMPEDGKRREIIDGELYVSTQPDAIHQRVCSDTWLVLQTWSDTTGLGEAIEGPGLIYADDDDVAPDVVWISQGRLVGAMDAAGHLRVPPELVVEVLSPGAKNEYRDLEAKLKLYSRRGVDEYWVVDWRTQTVRVYRRAGEALDLAVTLRAADALSSPLLPGFSTPVAFLFRFVRKARPR
jgi:Uma2 family endonuclease